MADKDTLNLIKFKFGSFQSIKDLSSKDQSSFYFASDKPAFYNAGLWYGVSSLTSSVNEETGEVTLVINGDFGDNWESSQVKHTFVAGMTTQQKADLEKAVSFVNTFEDPNIDNTKDVIDKWNEIVDFLEGFKDTDVLLDRIVLLETNVTKLQNHLQNTSIIAGDGLRGGGDLSGNRTIGLGEPSTITDSTINEAKGTTHTHAIDEASTEQRGIVRLNDTLTSESTDQALTAKQGKVLKEHIDETVEHIDDMFELIDKGNGVKEIKAKYGLWSDSFISARGVDNESSGVGGLDAQAVWDLLMQNDDATKIINVAHIPDITVAKITDFTAKVGDLIANKADKATTLSGYGITDAVTLNTAQTITGEKTFAKRLFFDTTGLGTDWARGLMYKNKGNILGGLGAYGTKESSVFFFYLGWGADNLADLTSFRVGESLFTYKGNTIYHAGNLSPVTTNTEQTITGVKTFSNLRVNNSTMIANLNAEMVGGYNATRLIKQGSNIKTSIYSDSFIGYGTSEGGWISYGAALNIGTTNGYGMLMQMSLADGYIYTKARKAGVLDDSWKQLAFIDTNILTPSGGTLNINGNLTVDSLIASIQSTNIVNGTGSLAGDIDPTTLPLIGALSANKFFGTPAEKVIVEYSNDSGDTWSDYSLFASHKFNLFGERIGNVYLYLGGYGASGSTDNQLRITITAHGVYDLNKIFAWFSTNGNTCYCDCERYNYNGKWYSVWSGREINCLDGPNVFNFNSFSMNEDPTNTSYNSKLRLTFYQTAMGNSTKNAVLVNIRGFGNLTWTAHNNITKFGRLYDIDREFNALFQNGVYPNSNGIGSLGSSISKWNSAYINNVYSGNLQVDGDSIINGKLTVANQLTIGNATLYWDVANQCLRVNSGIASDAFLSAKGIDTTGNGQGGGGGFDAQMLWNELTIPSPTNAGKTIMLDLLPDMPTSKVTDFANQVKALITVENIPTLTSAKISDFNSAVATAMSSTLSDISSNLSNHEQRLQAIEQALTWQGI